MEIAEIRNKALRERRWAADQPLPPAQPSRSPDDQGPAPDSGEPESALPDLAATLYSSPGYSSCDEWPEEAFDPLATILAGRAAAARMASDWQPKYGRDEQPGRDVLCFQVADQQYAVAVDDLKEIILPREITPVPRAPESIAGIISLRGLIVPVLDLRVRLGFSPPPAGGAERIVLVKQPAGVRGLLVDRVVGFDRILEPSGEESPSMDLPQQHQLFSSIHRSGNGLMLVLDLESACCHE